MTIWAKIQNNSKKSQRHLLISLAMLDRLSIAKTSVPKNFYKEYDYLLLSAAGWGSMYNTDASAETSLGFAIHNE